jgi:hypothetical protein
MTTPHQPHAIIVGNGLAGARNVQRVAGRTDRETAGADGDLLGRERGACPQVDGDDAVFGIRCGVHVGAVRGGNRIRFGDVRHGGTHG